MVEGIINFVPGVSKKGTAFNRPILISTGNDLTKYFGNIDRSLEKRGSFFHRTILEAIKSSPVWALAILSVTDSDTAEYVSLSLNPSTVNGSVATNPYSEFFDKTSFWKKDKDAFLDVASSDDKVLHIVNLGDKTVTIFTYKSSVPGYDVTLENWYGGVDKVPTYLYPTDYASDYMIKVLVLAGDWTNYKSLAVDPTWGKYFDGSGLLASKVSSFINEKNVTVISDIDVSLIPYFRDKNGKNIFVESVINNQSDKTGIYCSFDIDAFETEYPNGLIDLVGNSLVDNELESIEFLSYSDTITETTTFAKTELDRLGNVIGIGTINGRTSENTPGYIADLVTTTASTINANTTNAPVFAVTTAGTIVVGSTLVDIATQSVTMTNLTVADGNGTSYVTGTNIATVAQTGAGNDDLTVDILAVSSGAVTSVIPHSGSAGTGYAIGDLVLIDTNGADCIMKVTGVTSGAVTSLEVLYSNYRIDTLVIDSTGTLSVIEGTELNGKDNNIYKLSSEQELVTAGIVYPSSYSNSSTVLGYIIRSAVSNSTYKNTYVPISWTGSAYSPLTIGTSGTDIIVNASGDDELNITFADTASVTKANYAAWRSKQFFNALVASYSMSTSVIIDANGLKLSLADAIWSDNSSVTTADANISILISGEDIRTEPAAGNFVFYFVDDEFIMASTSLKTKASAASGTEGVVAKYSSMYKDYYDGKINTYDYFYLSIGELTNVKFQKNLIDGFNYFILPTSQVTAAMQSGFKLWVTGHSVNNGLFTFTADGQTSVTGLSLSSETAFKVSQTVTDETLGETIGAYSYDDKVYLKMYTIADVLKVEFYADNAFTSPFVIDTTPLTLNQDIVVYSNKSAYRQTVEIESPVGYVQTDNKVLVDATRYGEIAVGDYLKAYVDTDALEPGEVAKKLTRVISRKAWSGNTANNVNYVEITCDAKIDLTGYGSSENDYQTERYTSINDYISTYKGILLAGFKVPASAMPDGTEARQSEILDVIGKNTPLFDAITNKETFSFRYLVDSFGLGLTEFSKQQLADICGARLNCIGFLNMPSAKMFKNSSSPSFVNADGTINYEYVRKGGDLSQSPTTLYTFADGIGQSCVGYFYPYLTVDDNDRPLNMPPAVFAMNTYMRKNNSNVAGIYPYTIAAGPTEGKIIGIGNVETDLSPTAIEELNKMGANPIVYKKNNGFQIETENTASNEPLSSLSFLHSREVLIELENELYDMLLPYQYKFNTPEIRAKIKRDADNICVRFLNRSALYNFNNICDSSNNDSEVIDNQFGILTTEVEIVKGMLVLINQINVVGTDRLASTGFVRKTS